MCRWLVLTLAVLELLTAPARPAAAEDGRRVALVVANAAYKEAALQNPTIDAELIRPALERMGFDVAVVKDADLATFALALESFYTSAKGADLALFYFAGHGFAVGGGLGAQNYLMSVSADVTSNLDVIIRSGGIDLDEITASLANAAQVSLVFVDACRNDPRISRGGVKGRGLARLSDVGMQSLFVGLSTRLGGLAEDGDAGVGSPFARAFAKYMPTPGVRLDDAFRRVRQAVIEDTGGDQRPEARDDLDDPLIIVDAVQPSAKIEDAAGPSIAPPGNASSVSGAFSAAPTSGPPPQPLQENVAVAATEPSAAVLPPQPAQRAIYYYQGTAGQAGQASEGTVTWAEVGRDGHPAVQATLLIPERHVTATVRIYKNFDTTLPASHLVEVSFTGKLAESAIQSVPSLVVKQTEQAHGLPVVGAAVPVTNELFWIALSDDEDEVVRNVQLLREGSWFDIPILFSDQTRALITFEKGIPGTRIVESVLDAGGESTGVPFDYDLRPDGTVIRVR